MPPALPVAVSRNCCAPLLVAQVKVTESLTGLGDRLSGTGDAMRRATEKVEGMRGRADAMDRMLQAGVLQDQFDDRTANQREIAAIRAADAVEDELARLKAAFPKAIDGPH